MTPVLEAVYGKKPDVADWKNVNLSDEQLTAVLSNIEAFPEIAALGELVGDNLISQMERVLPNFTQLVEAGGERSMDILKAAAPLLRGEIPEDVQNEVFRNSAYASLMGGYSGSPMAGARTARDLGRTSLDLIGMGVGMVGAGGNSAQQWSQLARSVMFDPSSMFITPQQQAEMTFRNNVNEQATDQFRFNVEAAPEPWAKGLKDDTMALTGMALGAVSSMYGGGQGGGYQPTPITYNAAPPVMVPQYNFTPPPTTDPVNTLYGRNSGGWGG